LEEEEDKNIQKPIEVIIKREISLGINSINNIKVVVTNEEKKKVINNKRNINKLLNTLKRNQLKINNTTKDNKKIIKTVTKKDIRKHLKIKINNTTNPDNLKIETSTTKDQIINILRAEVWVSKQEVDQELQEGQKEIRETIIEMKIEVITEMIIEVKIGMIRHILAKSNKKVIRDMREEKGTLKEKSNMEMKRSMKTKEKGSRINEIEIKIEEGCKKGQQVLIII